MTIATEHENQMRILSDNETLNEPSWNTIPPNMIWPPLAGLFPFSTAMEADAPPTAWITRAITSCRNK